MKKIFLLVLFVMVLFAQAHTQHLSPIAKELVASKKAYELVEIPFLNSISRPDLLEKYAERITKSDYFSVNWDVYATILAQKPDLLSFEIPSPSGKVTLELFKVDLRSRDYQVVDADGNRLTSRNACFYRGTLANDPYSIATVSFYENDFDLVVWGGQDFRIDQIEKDIFSLYQEKNLMENRTPPKCFNDDFDLEISAIDGGVELRGANSGNCVDLYIECDFALYENRNSNVSDAEAFVNSLYNEIGSLYNNENIPLNISEIKVWTVADPYVGINTTFGVLKRFGEEIQDTKPNKLCMLLSPRNLGGGIAWVDVLCASYSGAPQHAGPYAFCANINDDEVIEFPIYSWNLNAVSHEMGHNFGSRHTHGCYWNNNSTPIDDCGSQYYVTNNNDDDNDGTTDELDEASEADGCFDNVDNTIPSKGTTMSYCHLITGVGINPDLGFGNQPGELIRDKYENASCTTGDACAPLPVQLVLFEVEKWGIGANLLWQTESERNNEGFELYHSKDGELWDVIGWVNPKGDGTKTQDYVFFDANPFAGINYFRLKQIDFDGRYEFSEIRTIRFDGLTAKPHFFPNPANGIIDFSFIPESGLDIQIIDPLGRILLAQKIFPSCQVDISAYAKGVYWVRFGHSKSVDYQVLVVE